MTHSDRTARLLAARLELLASAAERGARDVDEGIFLARETTNRAVSLELLTKRDAAAIWAAVAERHPHVAPRCSYS